MEERKTLEPILKNKIRLDIIFFTIIKNWRKFIIPVLVTAVVSSLLVLCIPRYYVVNVKLAPEYDEGGSSLGSLGGLASMVGLNMNGMGGSDAISPTFYPDLMKSTDFLVPLLYSTVTTKDSTFSGRYMDYLLTQQTAPFWDVAMGKIMLLFKGSPSPMPVDTTYRISPFCLTEMENGLVLSVRGNISCSVDKKTEVISLQTVAQDPLVAALLAETVQQRLQNFITEYRTSKARNDLNHISETCEEAGRNYNAAQQEYAQFVDSHRDLSLQSYKVAEEKLHNKMEISHNIYNAMLQQKVMAQSKLQERTPVFTTLQNSTVPVRHEGPKRMFIVAAMSFLAFVITAFYVVAKRKE